MQTTSENQPRFDLHQFAGRWAKAVSAESGIAFSDYKTMHISGRERGGFRDNTPAWALDNKKIAAVILLKTWRYIHGCAKMPEGTTLQDLGAVVRKKVEQQLERVRSGSHISDYQKHIAEEHAKNCSGKGGFAGMHAKVLWMAYRLGMNSVEVAQETGFRPEVVRRTLQLSNKVARELFPDDTFPLNERLSKVARRPRKPIAKPYKFDGPTVHEMRLDGKTWRSCADALNSKHCNLVKRHYGNWLARNNAQENQEK